ncbi:MAG: beta-N-acetylhexosaminidase [Desulfobacteraceae bacterium]|nr:beta-N-acetylhexosaminidase [Desulfobacteraceae bacterium]
MQESPCKLSLSQSVGQRLMIGFDGTQFNNDLKSFIRDLNVGGLILFSRNLEDPAQIKSLCAQAQSFAAGCNQPPLFIAIDQEGGQVARLKPPFTQFTGNPYMQSKQDAVNFASITAGELKEAGINMNMAPVLDVLPSEGSSIMEKRSFGKDPKWVSDMGISIIEHLQAKNIMAVAKHFPGIGRTTLDSHLDLPDLDIEPAALIDHDLIPFKASIDHRVSAIMLSHIRYLQMDPQWPASLSPAIAGKLLRHEMGYEGLVITDDLDMGAICKHYDVTTIVRQCLEAEADILLICHQSEKINQTYDEIIRYIKDSERLSEKNRQSRQRILKAKKRFLT